MLYADMLVWCCFAFTMGVGCVHQIDRNGHKFAVSYPPFGDNGISERAQSSKVAL